jgi:hypothetical protein
MAMFVRSLICWLYKCGVSPRWIATLTCQYRNRITNTLVDAGLYTVKPRRKTYPKIAVDNTTAKAEQTTAKVKAQIISDAGRDAKTGRLLVLARCIACGGPFTARRDLVRDGTTKRCRTCKPGNYRPLTPLEAAQAAMRARWQKVRKTNAVSHANGHV